MRKFLLITLLLVVCVGVFAQNKTLGVGTASPNPNAALHVESPTNNQGMIVPRLTTAQRTSITPLSTGDAGLMVYDTQLNLIYIWNGTVWVASTQGAGGPKLQYPYGDTILSSPGPNTNLLSIVYGGSDIDNVGVANFQNTNPNTSFNTVFTVNQGLGGAGYFQVANISSLSPALRGVTNSNQSNAHGVYGRTTGTGGSGGGFEIINTSNTQPALLSTTNGLGNAGRFIINNASNSSSAIYASTNGTGGSTSAAIEAETGTAFSAITARATGNAANALTGIISDPGPGGYAVLGSVSGGGQAGVFDINNVSNPNNSVEVTTYGTGGAGRFEVSNVASTSPTIFATTNGTGRSGLFQITNVSSTAEAFRATTTGTGTAGRFLINNTAVANNSAVYATTTSSGSNSSAIRGDHSGADGYAGIIQSINAANPKAALFVEAVGAGPSIWGNKAAGESGNSIHASHSGPNGSAGNFLITEPSNTAAALNVETNSTGGFGIRSYTTGGEVAGYFETSNPSANSSTLFGMTNSQTGHGIGAINTAEGSAFSIFQGGMKLSTFEVTTGTTIATRAAAYRITGGGPFTLSFPSDTGDMYMVYNDTAGAITFEGVSIPSGTGKIVINFNSGSFRGL